MDLKSATELAKFASKAQMGNLALGAAGALGGIGIGQWYQKNKDAQTQKADEIKEIDGQIKVLEDEIKKRRDEMGSLGQALTDHGSSSKIIVLMGKTGVGKSTVANRMIGDTSDVGDKGDQNSNGNAVFRVGKGWASETLDLKQHTMEFKDGLTFTIVDTPGAHGSNGDDDTFNSKIGRYFKKCGGINMLAICLDITCARVDQTFIKLIQAYEQYYCSKDLKGESFRQLPSTQNGYDNGSKQIKVTPEMDEKKRNEFWQHVVIILTKCDAKSAAQEDLQAKCEGLKEMVKEKLKLQKFNNVSLPVVCFGRGHYNASKKKMINMVFEDEMYSKKYKCAAVNTPIVQQEALLAKLKEHKSKLEAELKDLMLPWQSKL